jgi:hypothetical protein
MTIATDQAYACYEDFSKRQRDWKPELKSVWSRKLRAMLGPCMRDTRPGRARSFQFAPLAKCRGHFAEHIKAPHLEWEPVDQSDESD